MGSQSRPDLKAGWVTAERRAMAVIVVFTVVVLTTIGWATVRNWSECRAHGFTRFYCYTQVLR
jgi:hypothetical protein